MSLQLVECPVVSCLLKRYSSLVLNAKSCSLRRSSSEPTFWKKSSCQAHFVLSPERWSWWKATGVVELPWKLAYRLIAAGSIELGPGIRDASYYSKLYSDWKKGCEWKMNWTTSKLWEARSRLYQSRFLQVHTIYSLENSWRALQDLHSFAPLRNKKIQQHAPNCLLLLQNMKIQL